MKLSRLLNVCAAALCAVSMCACGQKEPPVLRMATNAEFPPYEYYNDKGEIVGIDAEIAKAIADDLGYKLEIIDMDFGSVPSSVENDTADIAVAAMSVTEERLQQVDFSDSYAAAVQLIVVPDGSQISIPSDLVGKRVGVQIHTTGESFASEIEDATIQSYNKGREAIDALKKGEIDAVVIDSEPAKVFAEENFGVLHIIDEPLTQEEYAIGVKKGNDKLLKKINESIAKLKDSGKLDEIMAKYINAD